LFLEFRRSIFDFVGGRAVLGACVALAVATLLFIFNPADASDLAPHRSKLDHLMERRDTIYDNLRDLRFEFRSGNIPKAITTR